MQILDGKEWQVANWVAARGVGRIATLKVVVLAFA